MGGHNQPTIFEREREREFHTFLGSGLIKLHAPGFFFFSFPQHLFTSPVEEISASFCLLKFLTNFFTSHS